MNAPERSLRIGTGRFDPLSGELMLDGRCMRLRPRTSALLGYLLTHPDRVVGKDELMQAVWPDVVVTEDSIVKCVKEIRRALDAPARDWIRTLPRQGYAFITPPQAPVEPPDSPDSPPPAAGPLIAHRRPLVAFAAGVVVVIVALSILGWRFGLPSRAPDLGPSIVVLPFKNQTGDARQDWAVDDLTEAVTHALARSAGTSVIAPSTAFTYRNKPVDVRRIGSELGVRYVLEGALRDEGGRRVVTARLADTARAVELWDERFAPTESDGPHVRELVAGHVASTLGLRLIRAEAERARWSGAEAPGARELVIQAGALLRFEAEGSQDLARARALLEEAVRQEPRSAQAWSLLALACLRDIRLRGPGLREEDLRRAAEAVARAVQLEPDADLVRHIEGMLYFEQRRIRAALAAWDHTLELNPNHTLALADRGRALVFLGRAGEALEPLERAMRLSPRDPQLYYWQYAYGMAHLHLGHDDQAVAWLARAVDGNPNSLIGHLYLAGALGAAGRIPEARQQVAVLQRMRPGLTIARFRAVEVSDDPTFLQQRERLYEGLRRAGLAEQDGTAR